MGDDGASADSEAVRADRDDPEERGDEGTGDDRSTAPYLFLLGLLGFVGSLVAFVADLITGFDVVRSLAVNAASVGLLVFWAARDTLTDPESSVDSAGGAAGTALLLLGFYLLVGAAIVGVTSLVHGRFSVVPWAAGLGVVLVVVGFLVLPRETILADSEAGEQPTETAEESDG